MKAARKILLIVSAFLLVFVAWMNATEGYFQYSYCRCSIGYYSDQDIADQEQVLREYYSTLEHPNNNTINMASPPCPSCVLNPSNFLLLLNGVDFNR